MMRINNFVGMMIKEWIVQYKVGTLDSHGEELWCCRSTKTGAVKNISTPDLLLMLQKASNKRPAIVTDNLLQSQVDRILSLMSKLVTSVVGATLANMTFISYDKNRSELLALYVREETCVIGTISPDLLLNICKSIKANDITTLEWEHIRRTVSNGVALWKYAANSCLVYDSASFSFKVGYIDELSYVTRGKGFTRTVAYMPRVCVNALYGDYIAVKFTNMLKGYITCVHVPSGETCVLPTSFLSAISLIQSMVKSNLAGQICGNYAVISKAGTDDSWNCKHIKTGKNSVISRDKLELERKTVLKNMDYTGAVLGHITVCTKLPCMRGLGNTDYAEYVVRDRRDGMIHILDQETLTGIATNPNLAMNLWWTYITAEVMNNMRNLSNRLIINSSSNLPAGSIADSLSENTLLKGILRPQPIAETRPQPIAETHNRATRTDTVVKVDAAKKPTLRTLYDNGTLEKPAVGRKAITFAQYCDDYAKKCVNRQKLDILVNDKFLLNKNSPFIGFANSWDKCVQLDIASKVLTICNNIVQATTVGIDSTVVIGDWVVSEKAITNGRNHVLYKDRSITMPALNALTNTVDTIEVRWLMAIGDNSAAMAYDLTGRVKRGWHVDEELVASEEDKRLAYSHWLCTNINTGKREIKDRLFFNDADSTKYKLVGTFAAGYLVIAVVPKLSMASRSNIRFLVYDIKWGQFHLASYGELQYLITNAAVENPKYKPWWR